MKRCDIPNALNLVWVIATLKTEAEKPRQGDDACELLDEIIKQARGLTLEEDSQ